MAIPSGTRLGPYEILELIGAGGMGEVYLAHDTKLGRDVAVKVLPDSVSCDPDRLARFEREARTLAALNHPNIAAVYGVEQGALVMELVEGETLKGPLPLDTAINYARQIADALEAAHERGIIHRDLKPANVKITPDGKVKLLDFGLAKAMEPAQGTIAEDSPTLTAHASLSGIIVGTPAYMSPEQARGTRVDHRTDIWAFGVVLYEMVTGKRLFDGPTVSDVMAAVLTKDPPLDAAPAQLRPLLARCLERDPHKRLGWIGEVDRFLGAPANRKTSRPRWMIPAIAFMALASGAAGWLLRAPGMNKEAPLNAFSFAPPSLETIDLLPRAVISPNGRHIAYIAENKLWIRELASERARAIEGAEDGFGPFWSPDSTQIAFAVGDELKRVSIADGARVSVTHVQGANYRYRGGAWSPDGRMIIVSLTQAGLWEAPASGGTLKQVFPTGPGGTLYHPNFVPGTRRLILAGKGSGFSQVVELIDLDARKSRTLREGAYPAWSSTGHILFQSGPRTGGLWALPFSLSTYEATGAAVSILGTGSDVSASRGGSLVWSDSTSPMRQMAWIDRAGKREVLAGTPQAGTTAISLSPDGARVAYTADEQGNRDIWTLDLPRLVRSRFTVSPEADAGPRWTPSGRELVFSTRRGGAGAIYVQFADGSNEARLAFPGTTSDFPLAWNPDGQILLFGRHTPETGFDLWTVGRLPGGSFGKPAVWLQSPFDETDARFSPDGKFVAYTSTESGYLEVYTRAFPGGLDKRKISSGRGTHPRWSRNGREIFYLHAGALFAVSVSPDLTSIASPRKVFEGLSLSGEISYDVSPDGSRFLFTVAEDGTMSPAIHVIQNWPALLRQEASETK